MNIRFSLLITFGFVYFFNLTTISGQGLVDGFLTEKGKTVFALSYTQENADEFYRGEELVALPPVLQSLKIESASLFLAHGVTDKVNLLFSLPHITVLADGDTSLEGLPPQKQSNFQKASMFIKFEAFSKTLGAGRLSVIGAGGIGMPISNYLEGIPTAIGHRSSDIDAKIVAQYRFDNGLFFNGQAGYGVRTGNVPNATMFSAKVGYAIKNLYVDAWINQQISAEGDDIGTVGFSFPTTQVNATKVAFGAYYSFTPAIGLSLNVGTTLNGRNLAKSNWLSTGLIVNLQKKTKAATMETAVEN